MISFDWRDLSGCSPDFGHLPICLNSSVLESSGVRTSNCMHKEAAYHIISWTNDPMEGGHSPKAEPEALKKFRDPHPDPTGC